MVIAAVTAAGTFKRNLYRKYERKTKLAGLIAREFVSSTHAPLTPAKTPRLL
jgi:hypothetical protein